MTQISPRLMNLSGISRRPWSEFVILKRERKSKSEKLKYAAGKIRLLEVIYEMMKNLKIVVAGVLLVALVAGLVTAVHAGAPGLQGHVYWPDGTPVPGATVTVTNQYGTSLGSDMTGTDGHYLIPSLCVSIGDPIEVKAIKGSATATEIVAFSDELVVDLTLSTPAPALTPLGLLALVGLLSAVVVLRVRKRRY